MLPTQADRAAARRDLANSVGMGVAGGVFYGSWAIVANLGHGAGAALRAGAVQAAMSFILTLLMTEGIHALERRLGTSTRARLAAALVPSLMGDGATALVHWAFHTPEILRSIAPSAVIGAAYCLLYVAARATRRRS